MAGSPALRRTIRRCTAALVIPVSVAAASVASSDALGPLLLTAAAALFLLGSLVYTPRWAVADE